MSIEIVVAGAAGRVGRSIVAAALDDAEITLVGALEAAGCDAIGRDAGLVAGVAEAGVIVSETP
ncbi:MAG: 4-hydroxy-tetrahydrodipicolinate reductase, partial [Planctomycetota bacterium]